MEGNFDLSYLPKYLNAFGILDSNDFDCFIDVINHLILNQDYDEDMLHITVNLCYRCAIWSLHCNSNETPNSVLNQYVSISDPEDIEFKISFVNSWLISYNYPLLLHNITESKSASLESIDNSPIGLLGVLLGIINIIEIFDEEFLYKHGKTLDFLSCEEESCFSNALVLNSIEVKEQFSSDYNELLNIKHLPDAIQKRVGMEIEKYKNLQLRKLKIFKQIISKQIEHQLDKQMESEGNTIK